MWKLAPCWSLWSLQSPWSSRFPWSSRSPQFLPVFYYTLNEIQFYTIMMGILIYFLYYLYSPSFPLRAIAPLFLIALPIISVRAPTVLPCLLGVLTFLALVLKIGRYLCIILLIKPEAKFLSCLSHCAYAGSCVSGRLS